MAALFESSISASVIKPPLASATAPSMADSLPDINFGFDELREQMEHFTEKFDAFIADGRKRVLDERNEYRRRMAELEGSFLTRPLIL